MKTLFSIIALFALAVGLVVGARYNDGYVLIVLPPYRIEVSLNLLILLLAVGFAVFYTVVRLVRTAVQTPARVRQYRLARRRESAQLALLAALQAYFEGRYAKAEQSAQQSLELGQDTRLSLVLAARAAHELRAYDRRDSYLERAAREAPDDDALRIVTAAELLLEQRRAEEALAVLEGLPRKHTAALKLELRAQQQSRRWQQVVALVSELERRNAFDANQAARLRAQAWVETLRRQGYDAHTLNEAWKKIPDADKHVTSVATAAARCSIALGRASEAEHIIEQSLTHTWDSTLAGLYGDAAGPDLVKQIELAETWLQRHPHDAGLLVALGKLCARQSLWGKAQSYLEAGVSVEPTYEGYLELARLEEKLGNTDASRRHYSRSLDLALSQLRAASLVSRA